MKSTTRLIIEQAREWDALRLTPMRKLEDAGIFETTSRDAVRYLAVYEPRHAELLEDVFESARDLISELRRGASARGGIVGAKQRLELSVARTEAYRQKRGLL